MVLSIENSNNNIELVKEQMSRNFGEHSSSREWSSYEYDYGVLSNNHLTEADRVIQLIESIQQFDDNVPKLQNKDVSSIIIAQPQKNIQETTEPNVKQSVKYVENAYNANGNVDPDKKNQCKQKILFAFGFI